MSFTRMIGKAKSFATNSFTPADLKKVRGLKNYYNLNNVEEAELKGCLKSYARANIFSQIFCRVRDAVLTLLGQETPFGKTKLMLARHIQSQMESAMNFGSGGISFIRLFTSQVPEGPSGAARRLTATSFANPFADFLMRYMVTKKLMKKSEANNNFARDLCAPMSFETFKKWRAWDANCPQFHNMGISLLPQVVGYTVYEQVFKEGHQREMQIAKTVTEQFNAFLLNAESFPTILG